MIQMHWSRALYDEYEPQKLIFMILGVNMETMIPKNFIENKLSGTSRGSSPTRLKKLCRVAASKRKTIGWIPSNLDFSVPNAYLCSGHLWSKLSLGANPITLRGTFSTSHVSICDPDFASANRIWIVGCHFEPGDVTFQQFLTFKNFTLNHENTSFMTTLV